MEQVDFVSQEWLRISVCENILRFDRGEQKSKEKKNSNIQYSSKKVNFSANKFTPAVNILGKLKATAKTLFARSSVIVRCHVTSMLSARACCSRENSKFYNRTVAEKRSAKYNSPNVIMFQFHI